MKHLKKLFLNVFFAVSLVIVPASIVSAPATATAAPASMQEQQKSGKNQRHKPFVYAFTSTEDLATTAQNVKERLTTAGFTVVGNYSPYEGVMDIAVTNAALQAVTSQSDFGNFAAVQRVSLTTMGDSVQVIYTNPTYMALAYRLAGELEGTLAALEGALGNEKFVGSKKGLKTKRLKKYRYMGFPMFTERFTQPDLLATFETHDEAVAMLEKGLASGAGGVSKVYRVDVEGTSDTLFGVGMTEGNSGDGYVMNKIDFKEVRSSAHLPYEVLVKGNEIYALGARFRIAISFPDLKMVGSHSFAGIMSTPKAIKRALTAAATGGGE